METAGGESVLTPSLRPLRSRTLKTPRSFQQKQMSVIRVPREQTEAGCHPIERKGLFWASLVIREQTRCGRKLRCPRRAGELSLCVTQTLVKPPLSPAVHLLVSSALSVLLGKSACVCVYLEDLPAETLIPLRQITKNCQVFSVQESL